VGARRFAGRAITGGLRASVLHSAPCGPWRARPRVSSATTASAGNAT